MFFRPIGSAAALAVFAAVSMAGQKSPYIIVPDSSVEHPGDIGVRAHTNLLIWNGPAQYHNNEAPPMMADASHGPSLFHKFSSISGYYPSNIYTAYGVTPAGQGAIAIIDAYDYRTAESDFNTFSNEFGLPVETAKYQTTTNKVFQVVYASGKEPQVNRGWNVEEALDIEWSHAMAPNAKVFLIEAASSSFGDLFTAIAKAKGMSTVTQVSMSWGGGEFSGETSYDKDFTAANAAHATFFASSGDGGSGVIYPSASPNVVAAGGTSLYETNGAYNYEAGWSGSGGGPSAVETRPSFQSGIKSIVGNARGVPDISAVADPNTGVAMYDSGYGGWIVVGGTSVASPVLAGITNSGGAARWNGAEQTWIYGHTGGFHDITIGSNGGYSCTTGWDFVTGWGSPTSSSSV
jgi:subtilase family serine protease